MPHGKSERLLHWLSITSFMAVCLAYLVIGFGAFTRLSDAGLGCPDWPACYGRMMVTSHAVHASSMQPASNIKDVKKAHIEMGHRYIAGTLGLLMLIIAALSVIAASSLGVRFLFFALSLFGLLVYQVLLGMWTVTLKLWPVAVTQHLLAGILILSVLWLVFLSVRDNKTADVATFSFAFRLFALASVLIVLAQVFLGGWTSSHYAGLVCHGFPACKPAQLLAYDFNNVFRYVTYSKMNYDGGLLSPATRMTIQIMHRWGALIVGLDVLCLITWILWRYRGCASLRKLSGYLIFFFVVQMGLGILNVFLQLPMIVAVAHNLVAATLVLLLVTVNYYVFLQRPRFYFLR